MSPESSPCAVCWAIHKSCRRPGRSGSGRCGKCARRLRKGINDSQTSIDLAQPFPCTSLHEHLFEQAPLGYLLSFDTQGLDSNQFHFHFTTSTGEQTQFGFQSNGIFVSTALDEEVRRSFSASLKDKMDASQLIASAALAGGYLYCICSTVDLAGYTQTSIDGVSLGLNTENSLKPTVVYLLLRRLGEIVEEAMKDVRAGLNPLEVSEVDGSHAYAAAIILHHEFDSVLSHIKRGALREKPNRDLSPKFYGWLGSIEAELLDRLRESCGRFPLWHLSISGSMKKFGLLRRGSKPLKLTVHLHQELHTANGMHHPPSNSPSFPSTGTHSYPVQTTSISPNVLMPKDEELLDPRLLLLQGYDGQIDPAFNQTIQEMLPQVPQLSPVIDNDYLGQMPTHFPDQMDFSPPVGNDETLKIFGSETANSPVGTVFGAQRYPKLDTYAIPLC